MKKTILLLLCMFAVLVLHASADYKNPKVRDFYEVSAKQMDCYDAKFENKRLTLHKGDIIVVTMREDTLRNGKTVWMCQQYIPKAERKEWEKNNPKSKVDSKGYVKPNSSKLFKGYFYYKESLLTPIGPPDMDAKREANFARWDHAWRPLYEYIIAALMVLNILLFLISLFKLKVWRITKVAVVSIAGAILFYRLAGESYLSLALLPAAIFMPLSYGSVLLPMSYQWKERMDNILTYTAVGFSLLMSVIFFCIRFDTWYWIVLASLIPPVATYFLMRWANPLDSDPIDVCEQCGYYGRMTSAGAVNLGNTQSSQIKTTEYDRVYKDGHQEYDHTERERITKTTSHYLNKKCCPKCGWRFSYEDSVTLSSSQKI